MCVCVTVCVAPFQKNEKGLLFWSMCSCTLHCIVNPKDFEQSKIVAKQGGNVAKVAMKELEAKIGKKVVTKFNAKDVFKAAIPAKTK